MCCWRNATWPQMQQRCQLALYFMQQQYNSTERAENLTHQTIALHRITRPIIMRRGPTLPASKQLNTTTIYSMHALKFSFRFRFQYHRPHTKLYLIDTNDANQCNSTIKIRQTQQQGSNAYTVCCQSKYSTRASGHGHARGRGDGRQQADAYLACRVQ
jgi:hypothetical protein